MLFFGFVGLLVLCFGYCGYYCGLWVVLVLVAGLLLSSYVLFVIWLVWCLDLVVLFLLLPSDCLCYATFDVVVGAWVWLA